MSRTVVTHRTSLGRALRIILTAAFAGLLPTFPAGATVLEIGDDGTVVVHDRIAARRLPAAISRPTASPVSAPPALRPHIRAAATGYEVSAELIEAVAWAESRFRQAAVSRTGARGVMQLMPGTARDLGVDATRADDNIRGGTAYLRRMLNRYAGDLRLTLAAYNAGPGAVDRFDGVPPYPETRAYVDQVLARLAARALRP